MAGSRSVPQRDEIDVAADWQRYRLFQLGRIAVLTSVLAAIAVVSQTWGTGPEIIPIVGVVVLDLVLTLPYYRIGLRRKRNLRRVYIAVIYGDTCLVTVGEYLLGSSAVYGLPIYMQLVVMAAAVVPGRTAYGVALFGSLSYTAVMAATEQGCLPSSNGPFQTSFEESWRWTTSLSTVLATVTLAAIATSLSSAWRAAVERSRVLESDLRQLNQSLEERVASATRALAERNRELSETSGQIGLFVQAITHDLRNPLTAASEALRVAQARDAEDRDGFLALSRENLLRADRMLMGLRDLMRTGRAEVTPELVDVGSLLRELADDVTASNAIERSQIVLHEPLQPVVAGAAHLTHIFRNLLSNAIEHNSGMDNLRVEVGQELTDGEVTFFVRDNGRGIAPVMQDRVFAPFYRGTGSSHDGLGLGLALVNALVTHLSGTVWIDSEEGSGATFLFSLPQPLESREAN